MKIHLTEKQWGRSKRVDASKKRAQQRGKTVKVTRRTKALSAKAQRP